MLNTWPATSPTVPRSTSLPSTPKSSGSRNLREQVAAAVDADQATDKPVKIARKSMSAEGRRKIAEAQKARWAKQKNAEDSSEACS